MFAASGAFGIRRSDRQPNRANYRPARTSLSRKVSVSGFGFFAPDDPEEREKIMRAMEAQQEHVAMQHEDYLRSLQRMLGEMSVEHLVTLHKIFNILGTHGNPERYAAYLEGQVVALLQHKHNVCARCGKDHTEDILVPTSKPEKEGEQ